MIGPAGLQPNTSVEDDHVFGVRSGLDFFDAPDVEHDGTVNAEEELGIEFRPDEETECTADVLEDLKLPREIVREPLFELQEASAKNTGMTLCLAINYSGRAEMVDAVRSLALQRGSSPDRPRME